MLKLNNFSKGIRLAADLTNLLVKKDENKIKIKEVYKYNELITAIFIILYNNNS